MEARPSLSSTSFRGSGLAASMVASKGADLSLASLLRVLGTGSSGTVWLIADSVDGDRRQVAVPPCCSKLAPPSRAGASLAPRGAFSCVQCRCRRRALKISPPSASWEASEQHILARLDHPYIVKFLGASCDAFKNYLVLEASMAGDLYALLRVQQALLSEGQARVLIACLASAIGYVHEVGLVYRDLKPENVVMEAEGLVRLIDFGLTTSASERSTTLCGTPEYLAPEMISHMPHGAPVDWWALGVLLYELLHGYTPFSEEGTLEEPLDIYRRASHHDVKVVYAPLSKSVTSLLKRLLRRQPSTRLGANGLKEVQAHAWFAGAEGGAQDSAPDSPTSPSDQAAPYLAAAVDRSGSSQAPSWALDWAALERRDAKVLWSGIPAIPRPGMRTEEIPPLRRPPTTTPAAPSTLAPPSPVLAPSPLPAPTVHAAAAVPAAKRPGSPTSLRVTCEAMQQGLLNAPSNAPSPLNASLTSALLAAADGGSRPPPSATPRDASPKELTVHTPPKELTVHTPRDASPRLAETASPALMRESIRGHQRPSETASPVPIDTQPTKPPDEGDNQPIKPGPYCTLARGFFSMV